jgi:hypothetical protein
MTRRWIAAAFCSLLLTSCMQSEIQGTYQVEIEFSRMGTPIEGTLIMSTAILDARPPTDDDRALLSDWIEGDTIDANSCFILNSGGDDDETPKNVRLFDTRIRGSEISLPIEIYRTPAQHLEITNLEFFANAIGGDVLLHDRGDERVGRIHGFRSGPPKGQRCIDDLEAFRTSLRDSLAP